MKRSRWKRLPAGLALAGILATGLYGQSEEQIERFNRERKEFFQEQLNLTGEESEAFWPLYNDFQARKTLMVEEERNTFRYSHRNADNLSDEEMEELLEKVHRLKTDLFELEREYYHEKFPQVLSPRKVMKLYRVEWDFRRHLLHELRGRRGGRGGGRDGGSGPPPGPEPLLP